MTGWPALWLICVAAGFLGAVAVTPNRRWLAFDLALGLAFGTMVWGAAYWLTGGVLP